MDEVQAALDRDPRDINKQHDLNRYTALHIAAAYGNVTMVKFLIKQPRLRFGVKDRWDRDPLAIAILAGHPEVTRVLFHYRASKLGLAGSGKNIPGARRPPISIKPK
jgi:ankyrin repeat protein